MSETPKDTHRNPNEDLDDAAAAARRITRNRLIASGTAVGAGVALYAGLTVGINAMNNTSEAQPEKDATLSSEVLQSLVQESYPESQYIGNFDITAGTAVIDQAESAISAAIGDEVWKEARGEKYDYLLDSAKALNHLFPQPGTKTYVVELELDNNPDNGNEYIVTLGSPIQTIEEGETLPSPQQRSSSNSPDVSNGETSQTSLMNNQPLAPTPNDPSGSSLTTRP